MPPAVQELIASDVDTSILLTALNAFKKGDFTVRLPLEWTGVAGKVADTFNEVIDRSERMAIELARLSRVVGTEGKISHRASLGDVSGGWSEAIESVNALINDLVHPTSETARVIGAVAMGDLSQTMALEVGDRPLHGEFLRTAKIVNKMVDHRVSRHFACSLGLGDDRGEVPPFRVAKQLLKVAGEPEFDAAVGLLSVAFEGLCERMNQVGFHDDSPTRVEPAGFDTFSISLWNSLSTRALKSVPI